MTAHRFAFPLLAAISISIAGCASVPPPNEQLASARAAIEAAEVAGAAQAAPVDLAQARDKLSAAQVAVTAKDMERARRLADQSAVDAQLAQAKASTARARDGVAQAEAAQRSLRDELNRSAPATPSR
jgi:hypothetical protein